MARIDYDSVARAYEQTRALPLDAMSAWRDAIAPWLPADRAARIVDVGSGTGAFTRAFVEWFDAEVIGVEPSAGMLAEAVREAEPAGAAYVHGDAHALPLADASCDVAWLSTVIHHFRDLRAAAREVARVARDEGVILVRSSFPGRHEGITLFRRFPGASRVAATFPTIDETSAAFEAAGFTLREVQSVPQVSAPSLRAFAERVRSRADTTLRLMPDDEYEACLVDLERDAAAEISPEPVVDYLDLLVFKRQ